eukprot:scaffold427279_cov17-Prasinocladus_malaysianus.AAC.1
MLGDGNECHGVEQHPVMAAVSIHPPHCFGLLDIPYSHSAYMRSERCVKECTATSMKDGFCKKPTITN